MDESEDANMFSTGIAVHFCGDFPGGLIMHQLPMLFRGW